MARWKVVLAGRGHIAPVALLLSACALSLAAHVWSRLPGDLALARALQTIEPSGGDPLLRLLNTIGTGTPALLLTLLWGIGMAALRRPWLLACYAAAQLVRPADALLKALIARPRPTAVLIHVSEHARGYSYPSGHVFSAVLCYGALALLLAGSDLPRGPRFALIGVCLAIVLLMAPARVVVGAHWPSDVLGGWLCGGATLFGVHALIVRMRAVVRPPYTE
jgi:membrane-associated phospholipid phosphatase